MSNKLLIMEVLPDYNGRSIVNLMSSIARSFGAKTNYPLLKILPPENIKKAKNIVLLVIDGLGFEYLKKRGEKGILNSYLIGPITSVFPSTTVSALTTFLTGVAPQQHAFTGWYMNLKELGVVSTILSFSPRFGGSPLSESNIKISKVLDQKAFSSILKTNTFFVNPRDIAYSDFSRAMSNRSKVLSYQTLNGLFIQIRKAIKSGNRRKYILAYWPGLDALNHEYGIEHRIPESHFKDIDRKLNYFIKSIKGSSTIVIITSDHGFINTPADRIIELDNHSIMKECLTLPLCGEKRVVYCYVHPSKVKQFENYVNKNLSKYCSMFKSQELIEMNYFGLFKPNPKLFERVGDYILILKENYILKDTIKDDKTKNKVGYHGGVSKYEMVVPLIVINCG